LWEAEMTFPVMVLAQRFDTDNSMKTVKTALQKIVLL